MDLDKNSVSSIFTDYMKDIKPHYVIMEDEASEERNAFCAGLIFGLTIADVNPDDVESAVSGKSIGEELDEVFIRKAELS